MIRKLLAKTNINTTQSDDLDSNPMTHLLKKITKMDRKKC